MTNATLKNKMAATTKSNERRREGIWDLEDSMIW
jgi:hypothetical protein